ncbi:MAG: hypothetical protein QM728_12930 [Gordonia sp. (in: high G+C Gram-positive bacteria)]|uniref:hypothetical protein n=1 Tax=Gordonia sp. (in: high G+C Gram-positive bacteria) TaxID=84139 RepID=UPI0039E4FBD1
MNADQRAADALDVAIDDALAGDRADPALTWLADAFAVVPPPATTERVARRMASAQASGRRRRPTRARPDLWRWPRIAAAVLGALLVFQGVSNLTSGRWIAANLGEAFAPHVSTEAGFALIAAGLVALVASLDRQWLVLALVGGVPLGAALGVHGIRELNVWSMGAALHLAEGAFALVLLVTFVVAWRARRRAGG